MLWSLQLKLHVSASDRNLERVVCSENLFSHDAQDHLSNVGRKLDCRRPVVKGQAETEN